MAPIILILFFTSGGKVDACSRDMCQNTLITLSREWQVTQTWQIYPKRHKQVIHMEGTSIHSTRGVFVFLRTNIRHANEDKAHL